MIFIQMVSALLYYSMPVAEVSWLTTLSSRSRLGGRGV